VGGREGERCLSAVQGSMHRLMEQRESRSKDLKSPSSPLPLPERNEKEQESNRESERARARGSEKICI
jgi:hypothetical protein